MINFLQVQALEHIDQMTAAGTSKQVEGRVAVLKASVLRLWDALSTDQGDRQRFFSLLHQASPNAYVSLFFYILFLFFN